MTINDAPGVIVFGADTQIGLTLIRELGGHGCRVIAVGKSAHSIGMTSRFATATSVWQGGDDASQIAQLNALGEEHKADRLICVSESDIQLLNRLRPGIRGIRLLIPDQALMDIVLDKHRTAQFAAAAGIAVPQTALVEGEEDIHRLAEALTFPVVLKWSNPHAVSARASGLGIAIEKLHYCKDGDELTRLLQRFTPLGTYPMVQEYLPGYGLGQFFYLHKGEVLLRFQHRRLHEWPPEGGVSTLCQGVPLTEHRELQERSIALLQAIGWEGAAMVEYRYNPDSGRAVLMEINGRFWGSYPLAYRSKAHFAWYTCEALGSDRPPENPARPIDNLYCRNTLAEFKWLLRVIRDQQALRARQIHISVLKALPMVLLGFLHPRMRYYVFDWRDPRPALQDWRNIGRKVLRQLGWWAPRQG